MGEVRIVTDSAAQFVMPELVQRHRLEIVPLNITIGSQTFQEGIDLDTEAFFRLISHNEVSATTAAPSVEQFAAVYSRLNRETDQILSLHISRHMNGTWDQALRASKTLLGRCEIAVIDSLTTSVGMGMLIETAAHFAEAGRNLEEIVHIIRSMIPRVYSVFYVESLDYLRHNGLLSEAQSILGAMLEIKPFLTIEDGELIPMEKVRTQSQALDKLVEFVSEFSALEQLVILQNSPFPNERTRQLSDRLSAEFPDRTFPAIMYNPSLATLIGPDGMGIMVYENSDLEELI